MEQQMTILRDVDLRLRALQEARWLRTMLAGALIQLEEAKGKAAAASPGSQAEQHYLREAAEASQQVADLQQRLHAAERDLRRTAYLLDLLSE
jgi:hypothetical protein